MVLIVIAYVRSLKPKPSAGEMDFLWDINSYSNDFGFSKLNKIFLSVPVEQR